MAPVTGTAELKRPLIPMSRIPGAFDLSMLEGEHEQCVLRLLAPQAPPPILSCTTFHLLVDLQGAEQWRVLLVQVASDWGLPFCLGLGWGLPSVV